MAKDTTSTSTSIRARSPFIFTVGTIKYELNLVANNYKGEIATLLGMAEQTNDDADAQVITLSEALKNALVIPLRISGKKANKKASATIYIPRNKIEEAMNPASGLKGKTYGALKISRVSPITRRRITAI
jgi:hypothetical protein